MEASLTILLWCLGGFAAIALPAIIAMVTLLWRINGAQIKADTRLESIEHDVNQIWILHEKSQERHGSADTRLQLLETVQQMNH